MQTAGVRVSVLAWSAGVRRNRRVRKGAKSVAWFLADWPGFATAGCRATDAEIGVELDLKENTIKNAVLLLRALGHVAWDWRTIRGVEVRTIRPAVAARQAYIIEQAEAEEADKAPSTPAEQEAASTEGECSPAAMPARTKRPALPTYMLPPDRQIQKAKGFAHRLPWTSPLRCSADCGRQATFICADGGDVFCYADRGCANAPVVLAQFGIGPEAQAGGRTSYGDFRGS